MSTAQLLITLDPSGRIIAELPGANGSRRRVDLESHREGALEAMRRILRGQLTQAVEIGLDGAPTEAQVRHWVRHCDLDGPQFGDPQCPFCIAEGRFEGRGSRPPRLRQKWTSAGDGSVSVRHLAPKSRKITPKAITLEDLGL